jgi:hypothetical protein
MRNRVRSHRVVSARRWRVGAAIVALGLVVVSASVASPQRAAVRPENASPPTINGDAVVDSRLTANPGTWNGSGPISFQYQWLVCGGTGENCGNIVGETDKNYRVRNGDVGNTIRVKVIASNASGSGNANSDPTAKVTAATTTTATTTTATTTTATTTTTPAPSTGCPPGKGTISISDMSLPARLLIDNVTGSPSTLGRNTSTLIVNVRVTNTCGQTVRGALVYVTATPYNQFDIPAEVPTNGSGVATLTMHRLTGYPVSNKQQLLALFVRARKDGEDILAGVSVRRLVSLPVNLSQ